MLWSCCSVCGLLSRPSSPLRGLVASLHTSLCAQLETRRGCVRAGQWFVLQVWLRLAVWFSVCHWQCVACRADEGELVNVERAVGNLKAAKAKERREEGDGEGARKKKGRVGRVKNRRVPKKSKAPPGKAAGKGVKGGGVNKKGRKPQKG